MTIDQVKKQVTSKSVCLWAILALGGCSSRSELRSRIAQNEDALFNYAGTGTLRDMTFSDSWVIVNKTRTIGRGLRPVLTCARAPKCDAACAYAAQWRAYRSESCVGGASGGAAAVERG